MLNSVITVVWLTTVVKKQGHTYNDSVSHVFFPHEMISVFIKTKTHTAFFSPPPSRQAVSCSCSSTCICWAATTSGCFAKASTCTLWLLWRCLQKNSISCGIIYWGGVSKELSEYFTLIHTHKSHQYANVIFLVCTGFPLVPAVIHSIARHCYYNDKWVFLNIWRYLCTWVMHFHVP